MDDWRTGDLLDWAESHARATDPITSKVAATDVAAVLTRLESQFLAELLAKGEATSNEVAASIAGENFGRRNTLRRRASDLLAKHCIEATGARECAVTGKKATVYKVVNKNG